MLAFEKQPNGVVCEREEEPTLALISTCHWNGIPPTSAGEGKGCKSHPAVQCGVIVLDTRLLAAGMKQEFTPIDIYSQQWWSLAL